MERSIVDPMVIDAMVTWLRAHAVTLNEPDLRRLSRAARPKLRLAIEFLVLARSTDRVETHLYFVAIARRCGASDEDIVSTYSDVLANSSNRSIVLIASRQLAELGGAPNPVIDKLKEFLEGPDRGERRMAAKIIGLFGHDAADAVDVLWTAYRHDQDEKDGASLREKLGNRMEGDDWRHEILRALVAIDEPSRRLIPSMLAEYAKASGELRPSLRAALVALGGKDEKIVPVVLDGLASEDRAERSDAAELSPLVAASASVDDRLAEIAAKDAGTDVRAVAFGALRSRNPAHSKLAGIAKDVLDEALLASTEEEFLSTSGLLGVAVQVLESVATVETQASLRESLRLLMVRWSLDDIRVVMAVMDRLGPSDGLTIEDLVRDLRQTENSTARCYAAWALGHVGAAARAAVPEMIEAAKTGDPRLRNRIVRAFETLGMNADGADGAVGFLIELLDDWPRSDRNGPGSRALGFGRHVDRGVEFESILSALIAIGPAAEMAIPLLERLVDAGAVDGASIDRAIARIRRDFGDIVTIKIDDGRRDVDVDGGAAPSTRPSRRRAATRTATEVVRESGGSFSFYVGSRGSAWQNDIAELNLRRKADGAVEVRVISRRYSDDGVRRHRDFLDGMMTLQAPFTSSTDVIRGRIHLRYPTAALSGNFEIDNPFRTE